MAGFRGKLYRDDAMVLRAQKLGESDRIITLLTRHNGRVRAVAKGVRRTSSRFGGRLEPFGHIDVQLAQAHSLEVVNQVEGLHLFGKTLQVDYPRYTCASAICEAAERFSPVEHESTPELFRLTFGAVRSLARAEHDPTLTLDAYLLRAMGQAGWAPALRECAVCGSPGQHRSFSVPSGGCVCPDCRPPGSTYPAQSTVTLMAALVDGDWATAQETETSARDQASGLVAAHLQWHLERRLRSLPLVDRSSR